MKAKKIISAIITSIFTVAFVLCQMPTASAVDHYADELNAMANKIAILVNEVREENGLQPLYVVPYLNDVAQIRAAETVNDFSHTRQGKSFASAIDTSVVDYWLATENLVGGANTPEFAMELWMDSEKHRENILNPRLTHMGIGLVYEENSTYEWYWTQIFVDTDQEFTNQYLPLEKEIIPASVGDINGDKIVDCFDLVCLKDYLYKKKINVPVYFNDAQLDAADCFKDGLITDSDAKVLTRYLLGEYKTLPYIF